MYLVDTSVWIDYLRGRNNNADLFFQEILENDIPFGMTGLIYQEVLQGAKTVSDYKKLDEYLSSQHFFHPADNVKSYQKAARIYFECRQKGITIRSTIDCLIAQIAIENRLVLLHADQDFVRIGNVMPSLKMEFISG